MAFNTAGLSLDQAPPLRVPIRFFLTAPVFGLVAALLLVWQGEGLLLSRWSPQVLALTHLLTLGVLGMVMVGAMFQMLPVVVGVPVPHALAWARGIHLGLSIGVICLTGGWWAGLPTLLVLAWPFLALSLGGFVGMAGYCLWRAPRGFATVWGMRAAVFALLITLGAGLTLLAGHAFEGMPLLRVPVTDLHLLWGLIGWIGLLIVGVAYQVVPMFQMTPEYPALHRRLLAVSVLCLLLGWSLMQWVSLPGHVAVAFEVGLAACGLLFAGTTLWLQARRLRKVRDVTLWFWRLAMLMLAISAVGAASGWMKGPGPDPWLTLFLVGFAWSAVNGMLYKILPFLVWFHLQALIFRQPKPDFSQIPHMAKVIPVQRLRTQFLLHLLGLLALALALFWQPGWVRGAGLFFAASFSLLGLNLDTAYRRYHASLARIQAAP